MSLVELQKHGSSRDPAAESHRKSMSATEQRVLEDFDYGKSKKRHDEVRVRQPKIMTEA